jgi:hypothetical protein
MFMKILSHKKMMFIEIPKKKKVTKRRLPEDTSINQKKRRIQIPKVIDCLKKKKKTFVSDIYKKTSIANEQKKQQKVCVQQSVSKRKRSNSRSRRRTRRKKHS